MPKDSVKEARTAIEFMMQNLGQYLTRGTSPALGAQDLLQGLAGGTPEFRDVMEGINALMASIQGSSPGQQTALSPELRQVFDTAMSSLPAMQSLLQGVTPETADTRQRLLNFAGHLDERGFSPEMKDIRNLAYVLMNNGSGMTPEMDQVSQSALQMLMSGGRTPDTARGLNEFANTLGMGGRTPLTSQMFGQGQGLVSSGGMTPDMVRLLQQISTMMAGGGMTPEARRLFEAVMQIVDAGGAGGALLPLDKVTTFAREDAQKAIMDQASIAARQAQARLGDSVGSGLAGNVMASFADDAAQARAAAAREAVTKQQELQLQQLLGAMATGGDITKAAQTLLGQYVGAGSDVMRSAASNVATGAGLMSDAEKIAAQRYGTATQGLEGLLGQELARYQTGGDLFSAIAQQALSRMGLGADIMRSNEAAAIANLFGLSDQLGKVDQTELSRSLGGVQGLTALLGIGGGLGQFGQEMDLNSFSTVTDALLTALGLKGTAAANQGQLQLGAGQGLNTNASNWLQLVDTAMKGTAGLQSNLINAAAQPGFWSQFAQQALGGLVGGLTGGLGDMLTGSIFGGGRGVNDISRPGERR